MSGQMLFFFYNRMPLFLLDATGLGPSFGTDACWNPLKEVHTDDGAVLLWLFCHFFESRLGQFMAWHLPLPNFHVHKTHTSPLSSASPKICGVVGVLPREIWRHFLCRKLYTIYFLKMTEGPVFALGTAVVTPKKRLVSYPFRSSERPNKLSKYLPLLPLQASCQAAPTFFLACSQS